MDLPDSFACAGTTATGTGTARTSGRRFSTRGLSIARRPGPASSGICAVCGGPAATSTGGTSCARASCRRICRVRRWCRSTPLVTPTNPRRATAATASDIGTKVLAQPVLVSDIWKTGFQENGPFLRVFRNDKLSGGVNSSGRTAIGNSDTLTGLITQLDFAIECRNANRAPR